MADPKPLSKPYLPQEVPDRSLVFEVFHLMPPWEDVKHCYESPGNGGPWLALFDTWVFHGLDKFQIDSKDEIDPDKAIRHIRCVMMSRQPRHEDKTASCAFLLEEWFKSARYKKKGSDKWVYINSFAADWEGD